MAPLPKDEGKLLEEIHLQLASQVQQLQLASQVQQLQLEEHKVQQVSKYERKLVWHNIIIIGGLHLLTISLTLPWFHWYFNWKLTCWGLWYGTLGGIGITGGPHRLWSHRSYKARLPLRIILATCFIAAGQNSIIEWVRDHRVHHKFTETDADPHNAQRGFFFAHVGWLFVRKHPEVLRKGKKVDLDDVLADPVVQFFEKYYWPLKMLLVLAIPWAIPVYFWNEDPFDSFLTCIPRVVILNNLSWLVNSAAHMYGNKPYDKSINPTENWFVAFVSCGEGWHNYHHVFPWDYRTSEHNYFLNLTTIVLDAFALLGWAYDRKTVSADVARRVAQRRGDGSHRGHQEHVRDERHQEYDHQQEVTLEEYERILHEQDDVRASQSG